MRLDFLGVGFGRTGSNWLCNCLIEHPEISIPKFNLHTEINYFPEEYKVMGLGNYIKKFKDCDFKKLVGELSTMIILHKNAAKLIKNLFPEVKIIIYQRSEEGRVNSVYNIKKYHDLLPITKEDLVINQKEYIEPWIKEFGKEKVFIFNMDTKEKQREFNKLLNFLGVKEFVPSKINERTNTSYSDPIKKTPIQCRYPKTRKLINFLKDKMSKDKKMYYFMKRNLHLDYFYQEINHNMSS